MGVEYNIGIDFEMTKNTVDTRTLNDVLLFEIIKRLDKFTSNDVTDDTILAFLEMDRDSLDSLKTNEVLVTNLKNKIDYLLNKYGD